MLKEFHKDRLNQLGDKNYFVKKRKWISAKRRVFEKILDFFFILTHIIISRCLALYFLDICIEMLIPDRCVRLRKDVIAHRQVT